MKFLAVLLALATVAVAQDSCPIKFEKIDPIYSNPRDPLRRYHLKLKWRNVSGKEIVGSKFSAKFYDPTGDPHDMLQDMIGDAKTKPQKSAEFAFDDGYEVGSWGHRKVEVWPIKIAYADGTAWEDNGSRSCVADSVGSKGNWWK